MTARQRSAPRARALILGAGYAGLSVAKRVHRYAGSRIQVTLVDEHPVHVLRTELYQVDRIAESVTNPRSWALPIAEVLSSRQADFHQGTVTRIDLHRGVVGFADHELEYDYLAICLGSVPSYFGIRGARENAQEVYSLTGAERLAAKMVVLERAAAAQPGQPPPRVVVVGGASTGTEVAAEIATARWSRIAGTKAPAPKVTLLSGPVPLLQGFPEAVRRHAQDLLINAGVVIRENLSVTRVDATQLALSDGSTLEFDACVWCAGVEAPPVVAALPGPHGRGKRLQVTPYLELPEHLGVFGVGDVIEYVDPETKVLVPGTAQAALAEAPVAGYNLAARHLGRPLKAFVYREKGVIISLGISRAAGRVGRLTLWGRPAFVLKSLVEAEYARAAERT